jgi:hypothetical protein
VAGFGANEFDEFVGVAELAGLGHAGRQVAAQGDDAADAGFLVVVEDFADVLAISLTTSKVRSRVEPPAPKVTEKYSGASTASSSRTRRSFSTPSGVCGGKNSIEIFVFIGCPW